VVIHPMVDVWSKKHNAEITGDPAKPRRAYSVDEILAHGILGKLHASGLAANLFSTAKLVSHQLS